MNWDGPADFFAMGGYGLFVWGSYGVALALMVLEPWLAARRRRVAAARGQHPKAQDDEDDVT